MTKEPKDAVVIAARLAKAYPSLSAYSAATLAEELCAVERAQRRHAERCCSGEDGGYVRRHALDPSFAQGRTSTLIHDPNAEKRADDKIITAFDTWKRHLVDLLASTGDGSKTMDWNRCIVSREGDPRGAVLKIQLPGEPEAMAV